MLENLKAQAVLFAEEPSKQLNLLGIQLETAYRTPRVYAGGSPDALPMKRPVRAW